MKRTHTLYFLIIILLLTIIIALYLGTNEPFDLQLPNSNYTFKGDFDKTCGECSFNENSRQLKCVCSRQDPKNPKDTTKRLTGTTILNLSTVDMQNLQNRYIMNNNGQLSIMSIRK